MADEGRDEALAILNRLSADREKKDNLRGLASGTTIHAVERARVFGSGKSLEGNLIVETEDGQLHRITGKELAALSEVSPDFLKYWRLDEE